jgi:ABC-type nitrate/sulfonate/bicarbonate transport system substrate-binding protein
MYKTFQAAAKFIAENPAEAATLIAKATDLPEPAIAALLDAPERLALDVYPAADASAELDKLLDAAVKFGVLKTKPALEDLIFDAEIGK